MNDRADVSAWVEKAEHDLMAVDLIGATSDAPWDIVVFHAQQAAEKFLKALLVSRKQVPPKVHDLTKLLALCVADAPRLWTHSPGRLHASVAAPLRSRYPGDEPETAREDAEKGVQIARRIRAAVLERLPPEAP